MDKIVEQYFDKLYAKEILDLNELSRFRFRVKYRLDMLNSYANTIQDLRNEIQSRDKEIEMLKEMVLELEEREATPKPAWEYANELWSILLHWIYHPKCFVGIASNINTITYCKRYSVFHISIPLLDSCRY